jgi:hypothetical protein
MIRQDDHSLHREWMSALNLANGGAQFCDVIRQQ